MTTAPDWAEKEAREVVNRGGFDSPDDLVNAIAASLRAARTVTPGYVRVGETDHRVVEDSVNPLNELRYLTLAAPSPR